MRRARSSARVPAAWRAKLSLKNQPPARGFALRLILLVVCTACACALYYNRAAAQQQTTNVEVDDAATRIVFIDGVTQVDVVIKSGNARRANLRLELLETNDDVLTQAATRISLKTGANVVRVPLKFDVRKLKPEQQARLAWYRVRYLVTDEVQSSSVQDSTVQSLKTSDSASRVLAAGVVALSEASKNLFELYATAPRTVREGRALDVRVRALHPMSGEGIANVQVESEIKFEGEARSQSFKASGVTNREGTIDLRFTVSPNIKVEDAEGEVALRARVDDLTIEAKNEINLERTARVMLQTDKPLYQPGQTINARALIVDSDGRALGDSNAVLKIYDQDDTLAFRENLTTSEFGVASFSWTTPMNLKLGTYQLRLSIEGYNESETGGFAWVKISRYDTPNFYVTATPDRKFYLSKQTPKVEVSARYVFGQAVTRARVRVVRETERRWNYAEQKYDTEEGEEIKGELNASGIFTAQLDVTDEFKKLQDSNYSPYRDINYAAYITDDSTKRTEARRFQIRVTRSPIHVYVSEANLNNRRGLPLEFYVSASYADGTPATNCTIDVSAETEAASNTQAARIERLASVRTNRFGVAKVTARKLTEDDDSSFEVKLNARDRRGQTGSGEHSFYFYNDTELRVTTDKSLYRASENVRVRVVSNKADLPITVTVVRGANVLMTRDVRLKAGEAEFVLPYKTSFIDELKIVAEAVSDKASSDGYTSDTAVVAHSVLYPRNRELNLVARLLKNTYRPGETAAMQLAVAAPPNGKVSNRLLSSALGVVVWDAAIEERAKIETDLYGSFGFDKTVSDFLYGGSQVAGVTRRTLEQIDLSKPVLPDLELVAELLLQGDNSYYSSSQAINSFASNEHGSDAKKEYDGLCRARYRRNYEAGNLACSKR